MKEPLSFAACVLVTVGAYLVTRRIFLRFKYPLLNPVFLSTLLIIAALKATGGTLASYQPAKEAMTFLLGPATVALALPLYNNRAVLRNHALPVFAGVVSGCLSTIAAVLVAHIANRETDMVTLGAEIWFGARLVYLPLYAFGVRQLRSLVWLVSIAGLGMIVAPLVMP